MNTSASHKKLDEVVAQLKTNRSMNVEIQAYADCTEHYRSTRH